MVLSTKDRKLFFSTWMPLLRYVNDVYGINKHLVKMVEANCVSSAVLKEIAEVLWDDVSVIDEYLTAVYDLTKEQRELIQSWKRFVRGKFLLERHLKKGSIFISLDDEEVYQVSGITSSWEEMFPHVRLPFLLDVTLIPFKDVIISDGLVSAYNFVLGRNMVQNVQNIYREAKEAGRIHKTL